MLVLSGLILEQHLQTDEERFLSNPYLFTVSDHLVSSHIIRKCVT
jgi:hypothetical protein